MAVSSFWYIKNFFLVLHYTILSLVATPKFGGDQRDQFQKFVKKFIGKIKEYYFVLFPQ